MTSAGRRRVTRRLVVGTLAATLAGAGILWWQQTIFVREPLRMGRAVPYAVLGNSDSHAYHDSAWFPPEARRGGDQHAVTFQWTEILHQLRATELDPGPFATVGRGPRLARVASWVGLHVRTPRKQDFAWNFAFSGARCEHLGGALGQVAALVHTLRARPQLWAHGLVIIRIGINDLGTQAILDEVAERGYTEHIRQVVQSCGRAIRDATSEIRAAGPSIRVVLIGIDDNANWPPNHGRLRSAGAMTALSALNDAYDGELRQIAATDSLVRVYDERAWFRALWGGRGPDGEPAYRPVTVGSVEVTLSQGDALQHGVIADGHAGTLTNLLWARDLIAFLRREYALPVTPISDEEIAAFVTRLQRTSPVTTSR